MKKGALQISFGWLFAIIIGAFIIFLAIFGVSKLMNTEQGTIDAKTSKEIGILLNPLETSFESAKTTSFSLPAESRISNGCNNNGNFGKQLISVSQKSFNKWTETDIKVSFPNKYIFSRAIVEGKNFYIFAKPFDFPFKVSDLIYMTSSKETYCFVDAPGDIEEELEDMGQANLLTEDCSEETINVCFSGTCEIEVNYNFDGGYVDKDGERLYFNSDALMYAAIFADPDVYECQLSRLMQRVEELSLIYLDKANFVNGKGCELDINSDLTDFNGLIENFEDSGDIIGISNDAEDLEEKDDNGGACGLW